jgi:DeoR/GlpR family transcriptional regulator of sugar metabolism
MLVAERWQKIVQLVNERGSIRVSELSELCHVTEETIRRDLDRLESEGKLIRSHGGAISIRESGTEVPFFERETMHAEQKQAIAKEAVSHIRPHDRIILDASSTAWYMSRILPDIPLTVLTNSIKVAVELAQKEKVQVISTGGQLAAHSLSYVGPLAEQSLDRYNADKAFLSSKGVHAERGISEANEWQAAVKRKMIRIAEQTFVLADSSKFGIRSLAAVADWPDIHCLITDAGTEKAQLEQIRNQGINVVQLRQS